MSAEASAEALNDVEHVTNVKLTAEKENFSPDVLANIFARMAPTGAAALRGSGEVIRRNSYTFTLDGASATPEFFVDSDGNYFDVQITVRSLNSAEEIAALQGVTEAAQVPYLLANACLYALNGTPVAEAQKAFLWEGLGMRGRQIVLLAYNMVGGASQGALGKFQRTFAVN